MEVLLHSAAYAGFQSPLNAVMQAFGGGKDGVIGAPEQAKPWSLDWHMQQIGTGIGMLAPILASRKLVTTAFPSLTADLAAQKGLAALTATEQSSLARYELGVSIGTGLVYGGLLSPSKLEPGQSLFDARMRQAAGAGLTFGTLSLSGMGLRSVGESSWLKGSTLSTVLKNDTAVLALSGIPAAVVSLDSQSVLNGKGLPSLSDHFDSKYAEAIYNFSIVGAGLGLLTGPKANSERENTRPGQAQERAASDNSLANKSSADMLKELSTRLEGPAKAVDLQLDAVAVPKNIRYERDIRELPSLKDGAATSLFEFERNSLEHKQTPVRVYTAEGTSVKVVVPEAYAAKLDRFAELQTKALGKGQAAEQAKLELAKPEMQELEGRMNVQDAFRHALMTPEPGKFKEVRLSGESNPYDAWYRSSNGNSAFESAADTVFKTGQTSWYKKLLGPTLVEDTMHEWTHLFDEQHPLDAQMIHIANRIDNLETRSYAEVPREQIAILLGEYALHPSGKRVGQLMEAAPVTATAIGEGLYNLLSRIPEAERSPLHEQLLARAELMRNEAGPLARQTLIEKAQANPATAEGQNALKALLFLGTAKDLQKLSAVTTADLAFEPISDSMGAKLGQIPNLQNADLSRTFVGSETMRALDGKPLESLNLAGTRVTNASLSYLPRSLKNLDLSGTRISDQALQFLTRLQGLETLDLSGTSISGPGMQKLLAALPNTRIFD